MSQILFTSGTTSVYGQEFKISDLPNVAEFSNLFDEYKLNGVSIKMIPTATSNDANAPITHIFMPNIVSVVDYTDAGAPSTLNDLLQYPNLKRSKFTSGHRRYIKPAIAQEVVATGGVTGYASKRGLWCSFGLDIPHYGLKWMLDQVWNSTYPIGLDRYVTYYFCCRGVK